MLVKCFIRIREIYLQVQMPSLMIPNLSSKNKDRRHNQIVRILGVRKQETLKSQSKYLEKKKKKEKKDQKLLSQVDLST